MATGNLGARPWRQLTSARESSWRLRKRMWQKIYPGAPSVRLLVAGATVFVAVPFLLTYGLGWSGWHNTEKTCSDHTLGCGLTTHLVGTILIGAIGYYLLFLRR